MTQVWDRQTVLQSVSDRIWRYLNAQATTEPLPSIAERLFDLPRGELRRLAATHLAVDEGTNQVLDAAEKLLKELPSSVFRIEEELVGAARGPIQWTRTLQRQNATADPTRFICLPPERRYDTVLARLLKLAIWRCHQLTVEADVKESGRLGEQLSHLAARSSRLLDHRKLADVPKVTDLAERSLQGLHRYPHTELLIDFVRRTRETVDLLEPSAVREVIEARLLAPLTDDRLFELVAGFKIIDWLESVGFETAPQLVGTAGRVPLATFTGPSNLTLWWQLGLWNILGSPGGAYRDILDANDMRRQQLRPDLVLVCNNPRRTLLIEVKQTGSEDASPERRGVLEAMAYLYDAAAALATLPTPQALVVAWDASTIPGLAPIVVSSQDSLADALGITMDAWGLTV